MKATRQPGPARAELARIRGRQARRRALRTAGLVSFALAFALGLGATQLDVPLWHALSGEPQPRLAAISVLGHERLTADEVAAYSELEAGTPATEVDVAAATERLERHPWIRSARLQPLAGELLVIVEERRPAALLRSLPLDFWRAVEADGTPFAVVDPGSLPGLLRLHAERETPTGQQEPLVVEALALAERLEAYGVPRPAVVPLPGPTEAELGWRCLLPDGGPEVVLGRTPDDARLRQLAELLSAQPEAVRAADRIDMRFRDRAILRVARSIPDTSDVKPTAQQTSALGAQGKSRPASG